MGFFDFDDADDFLSELEPLGDDDDGDASISWFCRTCGELVWEETDSTGDPMCPLCGSDDVDQLQADDGDE